MSAVRPQAGVRGQSASAMIRSKEFNEGVDDVRRGRPPRYDDPIAFNWNYERGRQWATIAPMRMPTKIGGKANPAAVALLVRDGAIL
jgi:hypothetical protein